MEDIKKDEYFSIFAHIKKEHEESILTENNVNNKILIVDFINTFLRSFTGSPAMNNNGEHVGGISGFLYSIGNAIKMFGITRCILVADGQNGSLRKRQLYPDYKNKRKVKHSLNRQYNFKDETEEQRAMAIQLNRLLNYLKCLPVQVVTIDNVEADDVIAYIAKEVFSKNENKVIIMSSDKDFLQLVDERINVWSPTKKKLYTPTSVSDEYQIHPNNFLFYRTLDGDISDNIPGIQGVGLKTIHKYMPFLSEEKKSSINEIVEYAEKKSLEKKKLKFFENIKNSKKTLELNESLMQLENANISGNAKSKIRELLDRKIPEINKPQIQVMYIHDGLSSAMPDINGWILQTMTKLNSYASSREN